jgi:hypothetical protein
MGNFNREKALYFLGCAANYASKIIHEEFDKLLTEMPSVSIAKNENLSEPSDYSFDCHAKVPLDDGLREGDDIYAWLGVNMQDRLKKAATDVAAVARMPSNENKALLLKFEDFSENSLEPFLNVICRKNIIPIAAALGSSFGERERYLFIPISFCLYEKCDYKKIERNYDYLNSLDLD